MKKNLLLAVFSLFITIGYGQTEKTWTQSKESNVKKNKYVERESFPKEFKLFSLDIDPLRSKLFSAIGKDASKTQTIISLPNIDGEIEQFEVYEASNFEPDLQAQFPEIRAFSGKGITDKYATLKLSISPQGIQTMVFRTGKQNEFIEAYSQDGSIYAVFGSQRSKGNLAWSCSTEDHGFMKNTKNQTSTFQRSDAGNLKTMRLAQSCNGEYANYFGATSSAQVALVLAAFNATLTRCNGVYEKDLALHLNLVAGSTNVIYYTPATDPYTTLASWNTQLQKALNTTLTGPSTSLAANNAAYDIGHMFGASGGGGNAGCIGCVCVNGVTAGTGSTKGRGITSPADGNPTGDSFDIDYVTHEIGHQLGGNHTFSNSNEGSGVSKEIGSGITIMGYAGITSQDIAMNSIAMYHETTIEQIQNNLAGKTCPITTSLVGTNATPVIAPISNYTIPRSTPFELTGNATDADAGDALTYCWEQNDDGGESTGSASSASTTKIVGPNFISFMPTASPSRYFPRISSIVANSATTGLINGGDAGMLSEALSSVARVLNFRLTVRDNSPYSSTAPVKVGQTAYTDMSVTVTTAAGPFTVSAPNTAVTWQVGTNQNVTWDVAGTTANGVNAAFVDIFLSTDGGYTYPILLASRVPNDGSEVILVPNNTGSTNRIMVKGNNHIFLDISNTNFTITSPASTFGVAFNGIEGEQNKDACQGSVATFTFPYTTYGGFTANTTFSVTGQPAGSTVTFTPASTSTAGTITMEISNTAGSPVGLSSMIVTGTSGGTTKTVPFYLNLISGNFGTQTLTSPADLAVGQSTSTNLTWTSNASATMYDVEVATDAGFTSIVSSGTVATNSYTVSGLAEGTEYYWRVLPKNSGCIGVFSSAYKFTTGTTTCGNVYSNNADLNVPDGLDSNAISYGPEVTKSIVVPGTVVGNINSLTVNLAFTHPYVDDLQIWLTHPDGTAVYLWNHNCEDEFSSVTLTYEDGNGSIPEGASCTAAHSNGTYAPNTPLSVLSGKPAAGTWVLHARDYWSPDVGIISTWSIDLCIAAPLAAESFNTIDDLAIYPNPNNGNFTVQFNSTSGNEVKIGVHDVRGRQIFDKTYQNNGLFNQSLNLNNVQSGIYLVTVQDGSKKTTKKIVVE